MAPWTPKGRNNLLKYIVLCSAIGAVLLSPGLALAQLKITDFKSLNADEDWPWWRGPSRNGHVENGSVIPARFGAAEGILWKTPIPGRGHSSPIVVAGKIFLETADERSQVQSVVAYDLASGRQRWKKDISQGGFPDANHPKNTEASSTIASDGEKLFVPFFHHKKVYLNCLSLDGEQLWQTVVGPYNPRKYRYGYAASPALYGGLAIVATEFDGASFLTAFDCKSGDVRWRVPRANNITFSSPVLARVSGRDQVLISGSEQVCSYDPSTGEKLWMVPGTTSATCGTMVWDGDLVFASGGYPKAETIAVVADGSGRVAWRNKLKCYEQSMIVVDGYLYGLTDAGILYCWRAVDGEEMWRERLASPVSASPIYCSGHIYWANERGRMFVFRPSPERYEAVAENRLGDESFASPAVVGNKLLLRIAEGRKPNRQEYLVAIGQ